MNDSFWGKFPELAEHLRQIIETEQQALSQPSAADIFRREIERSITSISRTNNFDEKEQ